MHLPQWSIFRVACVFARQQESPQVFAQKHTPTHLLEDWGLMLVFCLSSYQVTSFALVGGWRVCVCGWECFFALEDANIQTDDTQQHTQSYTQKHICWGMGDWWEWCLSSCHVTFFTWGGGLGGGGGRNELVLVENVDLGKLWLCIDINTLNHI